jgi:hypothetical protein
MFFSEEKNQKTFPGRFARQAATGRRHTLQRIKVFWFFFAKKNRFLAVPPLP